MHIYLIYCLYDQRSYFEHICHYASCVIKQTYEICDKNISKKICEKFRKYLFKMKEFNENILIKRFFTSIKRELCLTKGPLGNQEGQVKIKYPLIRICFRHLIQIKKNVFSKRALFNEVYDPWMLYLSKIGLALYIKIRHKS